MDLAQKLSQTAAAHPDRVAVRLGEESLTYAQLDDLATRVAGWLQQKGIDRGDRIALMLPNVLAFPALYYGILRAGAVVVPMNPLLKRREVQHYLRDSEARVLMAWSTAVEEGSEGADGTDVQVIAVDEQFVQIAADWPRGVAVQASAEDNAVILYTSGTTGAPKGAQLTHRNMTMNAEIMATTEDLFRLTPEDVVVGCLPLFHSFGQTCALNAVILTGASVVLVPRFEPVAVLETIEREKATLFAGVPTMYVALLSSAAGQDVSSLRMCVSGGASLPVEVLHAVSESFGAPVLEGYGLSETSPVASFNRAGNAVPGSIGLPIDGVEMRVIDDEGGDVEDGAVGEIAIRGHNVMRGYWNRPDATAEAIRDGWFRSGDMARRDADGFYFIIDRKKDVINRGGYNIYPREIEEVLYEHPAVLEVAVIGVAHPSLGEEVGAAVALRPGATAQADELRAFVRDRVAAYKYPRHVWFVDALPKGATGKLLKRAIEIPEDVRESAR